MKSYVYLFQNKDIFNIGVSSNLEQLQKSLSPGELIAYLRTDNSEEICKKLHFRYSDVRIPKTDYFRLTRQQVLDCKLMLKNIGGKDYFQPIFRGPTLYFTLLISWLIISLLIIKFGIDPIFYRFKL